MAMKIGTYYYPEQWPREQWERDFDKIAEMGLRIVHMAEFAWFAMESSPGDIQLDWLSDCVEMCRKRDLEVILCTPTAAPPVWLSDQFPEVLGRNEHGAPLSRHGGRRHYIPTSPRMQEATYRIVQAMATRFGDHPSVIGWQIDNELAGAFDQSEHTHKAFRTWLRHRYTTIDALNAAWGNQFWNTYYQSFDQILMPVSRDPRYGNPHHMLDASRFWSHAWAEFVKLQADILRRSWGSGVGVQGSGKATKSSRTPTSEPRTPFITTNFMPFHQDADPNDMRDSLTLWSWDSYPVSGFGSGHADERFRVADPAGIEFTHDQMRSYNGRWALMEIQPGQINWSGYPCLTYPGAVRLWLWTAIAHGVEFITVYRFRRPRFGIEMWHDGLVDLDGVTPSVGGEQFAQVAREVKQLWGKPTAEESGTQRLTPPASEAPTAGIYFDFEQMWHYASLAQAKRWNYAELCCQYHQALSRMGMNVTILHRGQPWPAGLNVVVVPGAQLMDDQLLTQMRQYVAQGGHLVLTCRTGTMDRSGQFFEAPYGSKIRDLIGGAIVAYDSLPENTWGTVDLDGAEHRWGVWGEQIAPDSGTEVWASYTNMFYQGAHGITHRSAGKGSVTFAGVYGERTLAEAVIEKLCQSIGRAVQPLAGRVRVLQRDGYAICLNYNDTPITVPAPEGTQFLIGARELEPAGVAVWRV